MLGFPVSSMSLRNHLRNIQKLYADSYTDFAGKAEPVLP